MSRLASIFIATTLAVGCGGEGREPARTAHHAQPSEESALARAVELKRAGDVAGAWKLIEPIPADSSSRLDPRYIEVMGAWADARTREIGAEISGPAKMEAAAVHDVASNGPPPPLKPAKLERIIAERRHVLRDRCYGERSTQSAFILTLRIDTDGRVLDASTAGVKGDSDVAQCVQNHAREWTFPRNADGAQHQTKFVFSR